MEDMNHMGKKFAWSVILQVLPRHLLQKYAEKLLKFRKAPINFDSKKVVYLLSAKSVVKILTLEKQKQNFAKGSTVIKVSLERSEKVTNKLLKPFHNQLKERETFDNTDLKPFTR